MSTIKQQALFGEYMSIQLPHDAVDVSDMRQVPDHQEVFTHPITDQSIIIEILEYVQKSDQEAIKEHYQDLANSNDAVDHQILNTEKIPNDQISMIQCESAYFVQTEQKVAKFNETAKNTIHLHMGLFRLPQFETDILVTFNNPININPESSSHGAVAVSSQPWILEQFRQSLLTLAILNTQLFGC